MTHGVNAHETASYLVQTGWMPKVGVSVQGCCVSSLKGWDHGYMVNSHIVLTELQGRFSEAGFLGYKYKPFATGGDPNQKQFAVEGIVAEGLSDERQQGRREFLGALDSLGKAFPDNPRLQQFDSASDKAYELSLRSPGSLRSHLAEDMRERYY